MHNDQLCHIITFFLPIKIFNLMKSMYSEVFSVDVKNKCGKFLNLCHGSPLIKIVLFTTRQHKTRLNHLQYV